MAIVNGKSNILGHYKTTRKAHKKKKKDSLKGRSCLLYGIHELFLTVFIFGFAIGIWHNGPRTTTKNIRLNYFLERNQIEHIMLLNVCCVIQNVLSKFYIIITRVIII